MFAECFETPLGNVLGKCKALSWWGSTLPLTSRDTVLRDPWKGQDESMHQDTGHWLEWLLACSWEMIGDIWIEHWSPRSRKTGILVIPRDRLWNGLNGYSWTLGFLVFFPCGFVFGKFAMLFYCTWEWTQKGEQLSYALWHAWEIYVHSYLLLRKGIWKEKERNMGYYQIVWTSNCVEFTK